MTYVLLDPRVYEELLKAMGPRIYHRHLADKAMADAARRWWHDYQRRGGQG